MKKSIAAFVFAALCISAFADYSFPGWKCKDPAKFTASIAEAKTLYHKSRDTVLLRLLQKPVDNFTDFCSLVDTTVDSFNDPDNAAEIKIGLKKQIPFCQRIWLADAWKFCQANPSIYDYYYVSHVANQIGMSDAQVYAWLVDHVLRMKICFPDIVSPAIDRIIDVGPTLSGVDVKGDLQKLNRKFSRFLLKDKAKWEPVIAKIRTTLETY
jgi:hypothetical protein